MSRPKLGKKRPKLGNNIPTKESFEKVTGQAQYCSDFKEPRMLHAKILRSPYAHARILNIDISGAEKLPRVRAVVGPQEVPKTPIGRVIADQHVLCWDNIVRFVGDPVIAVAADTVKIAEEAIDLIEIDYEELPAVFDLEEAFSLNPPAVVHPDLLQYTVINQHTPWHPLPERPNVCQTFNLRAGDVEKGFLEADLIVENKFSTARIQHCPLETHVAIAWWEPDGSLVLRVATHEAGPTKSVLESVFKLPPSKVRQLSSYIGGSFGGRGIMAEPICALLAKKSERPVRLAFSREEMFIAGRHRVPMVFEIKDGVQKDGTLVAREMIVKLPLGGYSQAGFHVGTRVIVGGSVGTYRVPNFKADSYCVYTNEPFIGPFRGFGVPEVTWAIEQQMDIIAEKLGINPAVLREKNILAEGDRDAGGQITGHNGLKECLDKVTKWTELEKRPEKEDGPWKKGVGIAIGSKSIMTGTSSVVIVKVNPDGVIEVRHGNPQVGQSISTTLSQIAAEEFGVSVDSIKVVTGDTNYCGYDFGALSSRGLFHNGNALILACQEAKQRLFELVAAELEVKTKELATIEGRVYVKASPERAIKITDLFTSEGIPVKGGEILGIGSYTGAGTPQDPKTGQSAKYAVGYAYGANAVEVAVNVDTGEVKILRIWGAYDVGKAINPKIVEGQLEGGVVMTVGNTIFEQIVMDHGAVVNPNFIDYKIPTTTVMPNNEALKFMIVEVPDPQGPYGAKLVGELTTVPTAPAIGNAVYDAVGVRIKDLPITREKVLRALNKIP